MKRKLLAIIAAIMLWVSAAAKADECQQPIAVVTNELIRGEFRLVLTGDTRRGKMTIWVNKYGLYVVVLAPDQTRACAVIGGRDLTLIINQRETES